ncbi:hypothetical protein [Streptomyces cyaneofuscatus]|uniref:hypothetical protein n=1 Tax=Streptomyces cyaneofuscatus TaxID=66883 RepID=UPI00364D45F2
MAVKQRVRHRPHVMVMQPVLEIFAADDFALWPVGEHESHGYLVLNGKRTPAEVGTAVIRIADRDDFELEEKHRPCPTDPLGTFLHRLLTTPDLFAAGGFLVTDTSTGTVLVEPGCCNGPETRRGRPDVLDGTGGAHFGHEPSSMAERVGDIVRLTLDAHGMGVSLVTELPTDQVRRLVTDAERDMQDFPSLAGAWAEQHPPAYAAPSLPPRHGPWTWRAHHDQLPDPQSARARCPPSPSSPAQRAADLPHLLCPVRLAGDVPPPHAQRRDPSAGSGFSVATSRSWLSRSTRPCA